MYRSIDTGTWRDPWFEELPADAKLLFLYLLTNSSTVACGAAEINIRRIAFDTSIPESRVGELLSSWQPRVVWWPNLNIVWVRNFYRRQFPNPNEKQIAAGQKSMAALPAEVRATIVEAYPFLATDDDSLPIGYAEPTDSLSIGYSPVAVAVADTDAVPESETEPVDAAAPPLELSPAERKVVGYVKAVRGMASVSDDLIALHFREILDTRAVPVSEQALIADAMKFRDHWNEQRSNSPPGARWKGWRNAMTNWFRNTREPTALTGYRRDNVSAGLDAVDQIDAVLRRQAG